MELFFVVDDMVVSFICALVVSACAAGVLPARQPWLLLAKEIVVGAFFWPQRFLLLTNSVCLTLSAAFNVAGPTTNEAHDRMLFADVVCAGLPMIGMLFVFTSAPARDAALSLAFVIALAWASHREILAKWTSSDAVRSACHVAFFPYVEYVMYRSTGLSAWFACQATAFACCFALLVVVDARRKQKKLPLLLPHHGLRWTAHEDAHVWLGLAQVCVFQQSVRLHARPL